VNHTAVVILSTLVAATLSIGGIVSVTTRTAFAYNDDDKGDTILGAGASITIGEGTQGPAGPQG
jgi:hypothetical protein